MTQTQTPAKAAAAKLAETPIPQAEKATATPQTGAKRGRKPLCGVPMGDKKCGRAKGHEGDHKPRIVEKKDTSMFDLGDLEAVAVPTAAIDQKTAPTRTRDPRQQVIDKVVTGKHEQWVAAGKPTQWSKIPTEVKGMYVQAPDRAGIIRAMLRSAGEFHKLRVKFGSPARVAPTLPSGEPNPDAGKEIIVFAIMDRNTRDE